MTRLTLFAFFMLGCSSTTTDGTPFQPLIKATDTSPDAGGTGGSGGRQDVTPLAGSAGTKGIDSSDNLPTAGAGGQVNVGGSAVVTAGVPTIGGAETIGGSPSSAGFTSTSAGAEQGGAAGSSAGDAGAGGASVVEPDPQCDCQALRYSCGRIPGCEGSCGECDDEHVCIVQVGVVGRSCYPIGNAGSCDPTKEIPAWTNLDCCGGDREECRHPWFSCGKIVGASGALCQHSCSYALGDSSVNFTCGGEP